MRTLRTQTGHSVNRSSSGSNRGRSASPYAMTNPKVSHFITQRNFGKTSSHLGVHNSREMSSNQPGSLERNRMRPTLSRLKSAHIAKPNRRVQGKDGSSRGTVSRRSPKGKMKTFMKTGFPKRRSRNHQQDIQEINDQFILDMVGHDKPLLAASVEGHSQDTDEPVEAYRPQLEIDL